MLIFLATHLSNQDYAICIRRDASKFILQITVLLFLHKFDFVLISYLNMKDKVTSSYILGACYICYGHFLQGCYF